MIKYKAYINNNYIQIKNKDITKIISESIISGKIINKELFIKDYKKYIKDKNILSTEINIYLNKVIDDQDIIYYKYIFEELGFTNINILSTSNILDDNTLIYNDIYIIYHNNTYYYIYPFLLNDFLKTKNINKLKIISNHNIKENDFCKFYYYRNIDDYFLK